MDEQWKRELRRGASAHGMCAENRRLLEEVQTKADAIELYKRTIDWALEEGYPTLSELRRDFSDCEDYGIFVGRHFNGQVLNDQKVYVFHNCSGQIRTGLNIEKSIIPMLYFANGCEMTVSSLPGAIVSVRVPLYVFGQNKVLAEQSDDIECKIYKFEVKNGRE